MKVKEVVKQAAMFLADRKMLDLISGKLSGTADESALTVAEEKEVGFYVSAFNLAVRTIASEDLPMFNIEKVKSSADAKVDYSSLSFEVFEVVDVVDKKLDARVQFFALPFSVYVPCANRDYFVKYSYMPVKVESIVEEITLPRDWTEKLVALLMASDIFLSKASYDEHAYFKNEYKKALGAVCSKKARNRVIAHSRLI